MVSVTQLGYVGFEVSDLGAWEGFAREILGLEVGDRRPDGALVLRLDDYAQRIVLHPGGTDDLVYAGWELANQAALDSLVERLQAAGVRVREGSREQAALRAVERVFVTEDPSGARVELYCGPRIADRKFRSKEVASGFVTGAAGLGHIVITVPSLRAGEDFYCRLLGLRVSDYIHTELGGQLPITIAFLHANIRHHSLALVEVPLPKRINHLMLEVQSLDDVGRAFDRCLDAGVQITRGLGRHPNDRMFSFYLVTPSGFEIEYGWDGLAVDDTSWRVRAYSQISEWGHRPPA